MSNSPLAVCKMISPNRSSPRNHVIDTITIHCVVGQCTAEGLGAWFSKPTTQASANYGVDKDGRIGLYVEEKDRSWCTSSSANDNRAVTIEVASDSTHPYAVTDKAYAALIRLVADICKRNGIKKLLWQGDRSLIGQVDKQNMTVHRWFANKACPGEYLYSRHGDIANRVNALLGAAASAPAVEAPKEETPTANVPFLVKVTVNDLNIRTGPGTGYNLTGKHTGKGIFTIVEVAAGPGSKAGWGKLKSGVGWISLDYAAKL